MGVVGVGSDAVFSLLCIMMKPLCCGIAELQSFASGIEKDKDAVRAGLTWSINNGMVEGHVTKLKLIKRTMYGRAGFPLLRQRVLHAV